MLLQDCILRTSAVSVYYESYITVATFPLYDDVLTKCCLQHECIHITTNMKDAIFIKIDLVQKKWDGNPPRA